MEGCPRLDNNVGDPLFLSRSDYDTLRQEDDDLIQCSNRNPLTYQPLPLAALAILTLS
jgi:hypothetical protein